MNPPEKRRGDIHVDCLWWGLGLISGLTTVATVCLLRLLGVVSLALRRTYIHSTKKMVYPLST